MKHSFISKASICMFLVAFFSATLSAFAYKKTHPDCSQAIESCQVVPSSQGTGEMLWDQITRRFGNFISVR